MYTHNALGLVLLAGLAAAKICTNMTVQVDISARTAVFDVANVQTNLDATTFIQNLTRPGQNFTEIVLSGYTTTSGIYNISTQFCTPNASNVTDPTVQVLTHGIGFDKTLEAVSFLLKKSPLMSDQVLGHLLQQLRLQLY